MEIDVRLIIEIALLVIPVATAIARLTKTTKDDTWVQRARNVVEYIANMGLPDRVEIKRRKKK